MANTVPVSVSTSSSTGGGGINFETVLPYVIDKFIAAVVSALIIVAGLFAISFFKNYIHKVEVTHEHQKMAINLVEKLVTGFLIVIIITLALKNIGIDMSLLVSVTILGLSYGLQDVIKNYVAGILILFKSPFKIGDTIKIKDFTGKVETVDFQATGLRTFDRRHVTIYNSDVMTSPIINFSNSSLRRVDLDVALGYGSDIQTALKIFDRILNKNEKILKNPVHKIVFKNFSDSGVEFSLRGWVQMPCNILAIKSEIAMDINKALDENKLFMPYTKTIQLETDYTLNEKRQQMIKGMDDEMAQPDTTVLPPGLVPELVDFDEES
jgi:small conductance mechanosensitive channel